MMDPLFVLGFGYVTPSEPLKLDLSLLERSLRRGLSDVTRLFMHAAGLALADAALEPARAHVVFASAFGEIATADALLAEAYDANGSSPARFRHSVHNTSPGLLSISAKSRLPSTALSAGWDTVAMALCEASALLASDVEHVLLVFAEERVPSTLSAEHTYGPLGAAFVLGTGESAHVRPVRGSLTRMRRDRRERGSSERARAAAKFEHPLAPALNLAQALAAQRSQTLLLSEGDPPWCIDLEHHAQMQDGKEGG